MALVFLNGEFVEGSEAKVSVFDNGFLYGDGVYETMRTYAGKLWNFDAHWNRLMNSVELLQLAIPYSKEEVEGFLNELIGRNDFAEHRLRLTLTRGEAGFDYSKPDKPTLLIVDVEFVEEDAEFYKKGVVVVTVPFSRAIPEIKSMSLVSTVRARQIAKQKGAYEALFIDHRNHVTEGSVTNVYFIMGGDIYLPEMDMLPGTTRELVVRMAAGLGLSCVFKNCDKEAFYEADEIFLSNTTRGIVPVREIDSLQVGDGACGPVTAKLLEAWHEKIEKFKAS